MKHFLYFATVSYCYLVPSVQAFSLAPTQRNFGASSSTASSTKSTSLFADASSIPDVSSVPSKIEARQAVQYLQQLPRPQQRPKVLVIGGGLAGLSAAKH